ncbi:MAG: hypothetical protein ACREMY_22835, partial [bacterium]
YPSLVDYDRAPANLQLEPAIQFARPFNGVFKIVLELAENEPARFKVRDEKVICWALDRTPRDHEAPGEIDGLVDIKADPKRCVIVWSPAQADAWRHATALRILCEDEDGKTPVAGGIYLVLINGTKRGGAVEPAAKDPGSPQPSTIKIIGIDRFGRPVYDCFKGTQDVPREAEIEPAFRMLEGESVDLKIALDLPGKLSHLVFKDDEREAVVKPLCPAVRAPQLHAADLDTARKTCTMHWRQRTGRSICSGTNKKRCCTQGHASTFFFELKSLSPDLTLGLDMDIDPTVIQPPPCDPNGTCMPPPNPDC